MSEPAPLYGKPDPGAHGFIVVFHAGTDPDATVDALAAEHGFTPKHVFRSAIVGFAAELSDQALDAVRHHPSVKYVEHDAPVQLF